MAVLALGAAAGAAAEARVRRAATPHVAAEGLHVPGVQSLAPAPALAPAPRFTSAKAVV